MLALFESKDADFSFKECMIVIFASLPLINALLNQT
jgi:hypothetical protein